MWMVGRYQVEKFNLVTKVPGMKQIFGVLGALTLLIQGAFPLMAHAEGSSIAAPTFEAVDSKSEIVTFKVSDPITPRKTFTLSNPDRVVIDLPRSEGSGMTLSKSSSKMVKSVRFGQFDATTSRIVLDVAVPVTIDEVTPGSPLTVKLTATKALPTVAAAGDKPVQSPEDMKPLIAIDAGHGGQDPGALGIHGTHEKDVTLNFARALAKALTNSGRYRVKLVRDEDKFIMLHDRVNIARKAQADIMISLHADSNPRPEARGISIYTLSATASDAEAAALADRENKVDVITGINLNTTDADVANILIDLTQRETMNKSTTLADAMVAALHPKINRLPSTHRFAGFRVLKAPDMPSVLIELGFLSNATDERLLLSPEYRDVVVASVLKGIDKYYKGQ
jgi:N-acetylmuramoyl-L-alanine amidase